MARMVCATARFRHGQGSGCAHRVESAGLVHEIGGIEEVGRSDRSDESDESEGISRIEGIEGLGWIDVSGWIGRHRSTAPDGSESRGCSAGGVRGSSGWVVVNGAGGVESREALRGRHPEGLQEILPLTCSLGPRGGGVQRGWRSGEWSPDPGLEEALGVGGEPGGEVEGKGDGVVGSVGVLVCEVQEGVQPGGKPSQGDAAVSAELVAQGGGGSAGDGKVMEVRVHTTLPGRRTDPVKRGEPPLLLRHHLHLAAATSALYQTQPQRTNRRRRTGRGVETVRTPDRNPEQLQQAGIRHHPALDGLGEPKHLVGEKPGRAHRDPEVFCGPSCGGEGLGAGVEVGRVLEPAPERQLGVRQQRACRHRCLALAPLAHPRPGPGGEGSCVQMVAVRAAKPRRAPTKTGELLKERAVGQVERHAQGLSGWGAGGGCGGGRVSALGARRAVGWGS